MNKHSWRALLGILFVWAGTTGLVAQSTNTNLSNGFVFDGEPYLTVNPNNSQHIVVAWMGWINFQDQFKIKTRSSFDGGQTWSPAVELPHTQAGFSSADPALAFNNAGEVFVSYIDFTGTAPPVTGGVYLCKSTDGGLTWNPPTEVINTNYDGTKWPIDRPWLIIDRSNAATQGNVYVTTFPLNRNNPSYRPYLSISTDNGNNFSTRYIDTTGFLAGSLNPLPVCTHTVAADGVWYGVYPSFVLSQSFFVQRLLASSNDGGMTLNHGVAQVVTDSISTGIFPNAKKAALLISNPADPQHLALIFPGTTFGDLDIFLMETTDGGNTWTNPLRINDDPQGNGRMQDMVWGDFDADGDLIIGWRDRRNGSNNTYQTDSETWAAFRDKDSLQFAPNFPLSDQLVAFDTLLERAGNDFMGLQLAQDTLHAAWGDVRTGRINIWYRQLDINGTLLSSQSLASEALPPVNVFPNPFFDQLKVKAESPIQGIRLIGSDGRTVYEKAVLDSAYELDLQLPPLVDGAYFIEITLPEGSFKRKMWRVSGR